MLKDLIVDEVIVSNSKEAELKLEDIQTKFPNGILGKLYFNGDHASDASPKEKLPSRQNLSDFSQNFTEKTIYARPVKSQEAPAPKSVRSEDVGKRGKQDSSGSPQGSTSTGRRSAKLPLQL